jgi:hypothetical protein
MHYSCPRNRLWRWGVTFFDVPFDPPGPGIFQNQSFMDEKGKAGTPVRVDHNGEKQDLEKYLKTPPAGAPVAVEASGGWYWFVDALEEAGLKPHLVINPLLAFPGNLEVDTDLRALHV